MSDRSDQVSRIREMLRQISFAEKDDASEELRQISPAAENHAAEKLMRYYELLCERNKVMNLTAVTEFDDVVEKHFADSLLIAQAVDFRDIGTMIDVGTGAGFPGIPIKILFPDLKVTLLDALQKRVGFLNETIRELNLTGIEAIHGRAEDFGQDSAHRENYDLCVSRAVADLSVLSELCIPFVKPGGMFISYKSANASEEIAAACRAVRLLGGAEPDIIKVCLPASRQERLLVCIRKETHTPGKYPRRAGIPAKRPL